MKNLVRKLAVSVALVSSAAWASSVSDEVGVASAGYQFDKAAGVIDVNDALSLRVLGLGAHSSDYLGDGLDESAFMVGFGMDWYLNNHFSLAFDTTYSPFNFGLPRGGSLFGVSGTAGFRTGGTSDFETAVNVTPGLLSLGGASPDPVNQYRMDVELTETVYRTTDFSLDVGWYVYDQPASVVVDAASVRQLAFLSMPGSGLAMLPYTYSLQPEVRHRFGNLSLGMWLRHAEYVGGDGDSNGIGGRLQYNFTPDVHGWVTTGYQQDVDASGGAVASVLLTSGIRVRF